jgi:radical SAM superfamily enzyme YgiQ (UPF0313 family)
MKVLLTNPPWKKGKNQFGVRAGSRWPFTQSARNERSLKYIPFPFFLAYATAFLEQEAGVDTSSIDAIAEGLTEAEYYDKVEALGPDIIFAESATASFPEDLKHVVNTKKRLGSNCIYLLGGPHVTYFPEDTLRDYPEIDYCLIGEYEWTLRAFVCASRDNTLRPEHILGLAYRADGENIVVNPRRPSGNLDELPFPAWHHYPMMRYRDYFCNIPAPMANMLASRGCPFKCNFCLWPDLMYGGSNYRARSATSIVEEMRLLVNTYGFKTIYFDDDTFNIGKSRLLEICSEIRKKKVNVNWAVMARADTMDAETLNAMKAAGLYAIKFGVESGNQHVVDLTGKNLNLDTVRRTVAHTKELGIKCHLTFTMGLLGETQKSMQDTIDMAVELDPDSVQISITTPFPGTKYYEYAKQKGFLLTEDASIYDGSQSCVVRTETLSKGDIEQGYKRFEKIWRKHRLKKAMRQPIQFIKSRLSN